LQQPWLLLFETDLLPIYEAKKAFAKSRLRQRSVVSLYSFLGKVSVFLCRIRTEVFLVPETVHVIKVDRLVTEHLRAQSIKVRWLSVFRAWRLKRSCGSSLGAPTAV
jgi:hypothetical protein